MLLIYKETLLGIRPASRYPAITPPPVIMSVRSATLFTNGINSMKAPDMKTANPKFQQMLKPICFCM